MKYVKSYVHVLIVSDPDNYWCSKIMKYRLHLPQRVCSRKPIGGSYLNVAIIAYKCYQKNMVLLSTLSPFHEILLLSYLTITYITMKQYHMPCHLYLSLELQHDSTNK